jgi:hypothetical protein
MIVRFEVAIEVDEDYPMDEVTRDEVLVEMEDVAQRKGGNLYDSQWSEEEE